MMSHWMHVMSSNTMDNLSREQSFLSQGMEAALFDEVPAGEVEYFLKSDMYKLEDCLHPDSNCDLEGQMTYSFDTNQADSTQMLSAQSFAPVSTSMLPSTDDYSGPCNFDVEVNRDSGGKAKWEYSKSLNKIFVVMEGKIPIKFKYEQIGYGLFVRVLPIFLAQDSFSEPVRRCPTHVSGLEKSNAGFQHVDHVIRCENPQAMYEINSESKRLSLLVPLDQPQPGTDWTTIMFTFVCKNSCPLGMNRRSTALIFTLERSDGEILGRKMVKIRICSCPRRDMSKEEKDNRQITEDNENKLEQHTEIEQTNPDQKNILVGKKPLKRLSKDVGILQIRLPKSYFTHFAKHIRNTMVMLEDQRELTPEEKIAVKDCDKYLQ